MNQLLQLLVACPTRLVLALDLVEQIEARNPTPRQLAERLGGRGDHERLHDLEITIGQLFQAVEVALVRDVLRACKEPLAARRAPHLPVGRSSIQVVLPDVVLPSLLHTRTLFVVKATLRAVAGRREGS